ncbi:uncharacterized protein LOC131942645 [Physella acuta]|uniref:uncharacterized protein LOC131942645 n=1 Tax=Physella acuta TaxID=109671 RepID=UPI0027DACFF9|nr:uncharacterized protein LOC131942645 [Physella acuta]
MDSSKKRSHIAAKATMSFMKRLSEADTSKYFVKGKNQSEDFTHLKPNNLPSIKASVSSRAVDSHTDTLVPPVGTAAHKPTNMKKASSHNTNSPTVQSHSTNSSSTETTIASDDLAYGEMEDSTQEDLVHLDGQDFARSQANSSSRLHAVTSQVQEIERWLTKSNHGSVRVEDFEDSFYLTLGEYMFKQLHSVQCIDRATQTDWTWRYMAERWRNAKILVSTDQTRLRRSDDLSHDLSGFQLSLGRAKASNIERFQLSLGRAKAANIERYKIMFAKKLKEVVEIRECRSNDKCVDSTDLVYDPQEYFRQRAQRVHNQNAKKKKKDNVRKSRSNTPFQSQTVVAINQPSEQGASDEEHSSKSKENSSSEEHSVES